MRDLQKIDIDLFQQLTDEEFIEIKESFLYTKYHKSEFLINENEEVQHIYFIFSGLVKLSYVTKDVKEHIVSFAYEGWWETDFEAFYKQTKATLTLQCLEDSEIYKISYKDYFHILEKYPLSNYFLDKSINGHIANQRRILSLLTLSPKDRYEQFIKLYPSLLNRIPKSILSLYLGVSRETLSRLYNQHKK